MALVSLSAAVQGELRAGAAPTRGGDAFGDRAIQDCSRIDRVARVGEPIEEPPRRGLAPQILERNDAPGDCGGRNAEHGIRRAKVKARSLGPLSAADELSMHPQTCAERMYVETTSRRRPEPDDELQLWTWN